MAARERDRHTQHRDVALAWMMATLQRVKKIPKLEALLKVRKPRQTKQEMLQQVKFLSQLTGIPMRKVARG